MPRIRIDLDEETYSALMHKADEERRPLQWQAEVLIRKALNLPFPYPSNIDVIPDKRSVDASGQTR
jgi:hypothetical protein